MKLRITFIATAASLALILLAFLYVSDPSRAQTAVSVDFDHNGTVEFTDFIQFARAYGSTQVEYDLNGNGTVDFPDFLVFVRLYRRDAKSKVQVRTLGTPVRSVNWVRLHPGKNRNGDPCLYATMGQQADNLFVLQIDPDTGEFQQFVSPVSNSNYPTATLVSSTGKLYIGSAYAGHLLCFDPKKNELQDLGAINPGAATFPCRMDEDASGRIWIGSYPAADLTAYDPNTGEFTRYGRMDDTDMYNYPLVNTDGRIACLIRQTQPHVVVFDPYTQKKYQIGPITTKGQETLDLRKGQDGSLYIVSSLGNYRISGTHAVAIGDPPASFPNPTLPDGSTFSFADASQQLNRTLRIRKPGGSTHEFHLDYKSSGSDIFYVHAGPDNNIYGSSILPLHLFRHNPQTGETTDLGKCSASSGEAYSMANLNGKLYISSYPAARISVYDPAEPYNYGTGPNDNPRELGRIDDLSYRPRSTLAGPLGRIWTASLPDYGRWGGPLSYYDPQTDTKKAYYNIAGDGSCYTLAHLEQQGLIAVGTSISGGSGTQPKVDEATLFLWDYRAEQKVWEGTLDGRKTSVFNALLTGPDGRLYGTARGGGPDELFVFDPNTRTFTNRISLPEGSARDLGLQNGPDGNIYGFTSAFIYRLNPATLNITELVRVENGIEIAGPILGKEIYFSTGVELRSATLF